MNAAARIACASSLIALLAHKGGRSIFSSSSQLAVVRECDAGCARQSVAHLQDERF
jgi:hypothetical protein